MLAVLAALCLEGLYWSVGAVLMGVVTIGYIHWIKLKHTLSECLELLHVVKSEESCPCAGTKGIHIGDAYHKNNVL